MQETRLVSLTTPLGEDVLLFQSLSATDGLSSLFEYRVRALSRSRDIALDDLVGKSATISVTLPEGGERHFNGLVTEFSLVPSMDTHYAEYELILRPWLWFLTRTSDCRIFQETTVPDIVKEIFKEHGFSDVEDKLSGTTRTWNYCVQYRETDFNFVARLLEQEGIYYYFKHEAEKHVLVLCNDISAHEAAEGYGTVPFFPAANDTRRERDHLSQWQLTKRVRPGAYALNEFDFTKPKADLKTNSTVSREHEHSEYEVYDYPGEYTESSEGSDYAKIRIEELQADHERVAARGNARGMAVGALFTLEEHDREDQNREYLVVESRHEIASDAYETGGSGGPSFNCSLVAIPSAEPFRAPRVTQKPIVQGIQTAVVVGPSGEEIYTDEYGRIKVQFHWDRYGESNENSSCWIRVAQLWAGTNWGGIHIPRIGQEVVVDFLEGDPDRPLVTGRVYNADNMPPYGLPGAMTQSGIKSRSTKDGSGDNYNEIRFEDLKGEEQILIHAEKNQDIEVEHDETHWVGNDRTKNVDHDEKTTIGNDRTEEVKRNETITIGNDRREEVKHDETITIGNDRTEGVKQNETISIGENRTIDVGKDETQSVGENRNETVGKDHTLTINEKRTLEVGSDESITVGANRGIDVTDNQTLNVGKKFSVEAGDEIHLKTGSAELKLESDGTITLKGADITIDGSGKIKLKAGGDLIIEASKIKQN